MYYTRMKLLTVILLTLSYSYCVLSHKHDVDSTHNTSSINLNNPDKDMYVIHATVYQIGILTNKTDNMTDYFNSTGNQESLTLYHTNGTNVDLSNIPEPFLTNITAQTIVGVAPIPVSNNSSNKNAWDALTQLRHPGWNAKENDDTLYAEEDQIPNDGLVKRSLDYDNFLLRLFKRDTTPVKVVNGAAVIPSEAGIQSIGLPPLLSLNNNLTKIPVPIPNTSVVHYAKINTLVQKP